MNVSRRDFMQTGIGAISLFGLSLYRIPGDKNCDAAEAISEMPMLWLATGACSGCTVSLLNTGSPTIQSLILREVLPNLRLCLGFHSTVMAAAGQLAMETIDKIAREKKGKYILVVDGATSTDTDNAYCIIGEKDEKPLTGLSRILELSQNAKVVLAIGTCASYGGIPASGPNPTGSKGLLEIIHQNNIDVPVVNIPGCPPHPDWIVGTLATMLLGGIEAIKVDSDHRPEPYFAGLIHDNCPYRGHFDYGEFSERFGEHGCLIKLGCKGPVTHADCPTRRWNNGTNWCIGAGHPCIGCTEPNFPFDHSLYAPVEIAMLAQPRTYPSTPSETKGQSDKSTYVAVGLIGLAGFLAGMGVTSAAHKLNSKPTSASLQSPKE